MYVYYKMNVVGRKINIDRWRSKLIHDLCKINILERVLSCENVHKSNKKRDKLIIKGKYFLTITIFYMNSRILPN